MFFLSRVKIPLQVILQDEIPPNKILTFVFILGFI